MTLAETEIYSGPNPRRHEIAVLLACSRTHMDEATAGRLRFLLAQKLDWPYLLWLASWHRVTRLLLLHLKHQLAGLVPATVLEQLRRQSAGQAPQSLFQLSELLRVLRLLADHGIAAAPFKGPAMSAALYGDPGLRESEDLDVLIHADDFETAKALLLAQGFRPWETLSPGQETTYLRYECGYTFVHEHSQIAVDLHWDFTRKYFALSLDLERMWQRMQTTKLAGQTINQLAPEDLLLILCIHGGKHLWAGLNWICDVAELLRSAPQLDWQYVTAQAQRSGCQRLLGVGLHLAHQLLGAALPVAAATLSAEPGIPGLAARVHAGLFPEAEWEPSASAKFSFLLNARERWRDRVSFCWRRVITPTFSDFKFISLPSPLSFLYPVFRPVRVMWDDFSAAPVITNKRTPVL